MSESLVIVFASFRPIAGKERDLHELLTWMVEHTRSNPGASATTCTGVTWTTTPESFHLFERYWDEVALGEHRASGHYIEYRSRVDDLLEAPIEVLVLDGIDAGD